MTRAEIENHYKVENGIIRDPGKFEGEPIYAPYFWDNVLEGACDFSINDENTKIYIFEISSYESEFPELSDVVGVSIWEDSDGFVHTKELSALELSKLESLA